MSLTAADVAEIMRLVEQSGFDELNLEIDGTKISLRRGAAAPSSATPAAALPAAVTDPATAARPPQTPTDPNAEALPAPLLGTFYRAPKPGAPPFVEVGAQVSEDTIVGIIEVMKLMNTVRAGMRGTVTEILVLDGALVEFGETLMRVRKSG
ncbi:MAG TPA: acetyl-CoA carboxylase biotin carboxyl carrier protein [Steroidobacteraceae bacterium]|jgi:acetyl-CoA carboxylase biotin carboxyl carrier protein|nr:acetyl-CoA carboxylase biotin carboxyl carrier protein [Steroidobacteraceae bacterium]